jgi:hypothetical protein
MKIFYVLVFLISITGSLYAQNSTKSDQVFDLPPNQVQRRFIIELCKDNKMQIELSDMKDLDRFANMDSVIRVFLSDIKPLTDSLTNELKSKRIDYAIDSSGRKKIRIQQHDPKGSNFVVTGGDVASLKLEQDTIHFIGTVSFIAKHKLRKAFTTYRHYRVSFFLNNFNDLVNYTDGSLNQKIATLRNNINSPWITTKTKGKAYLKADPDISARLTKGWVAGGDFLNFRISADIQNYKNYFVPSFSLGAGLILSNSYFKRDIVLSWDPNFLFKRNAQGALKTFRNDFLTLTWGQGLVQDNEPRKESHLLFIMSLSYLINREGDYFEKNTFRMGAGRLSLFGGKTKIEPAMYFDHFFKGVTPALRLIQSF